jgi:hypothetical protein
MTKSAVGEQDEAAEPEPEPMVVGILADPGPAELLAQRLAEELPEALGRAVDGSVTWRIDARAEALPLDSEGNIPIFDLANRLGRQREWDYLVCLTQLPRIAAGRPVVADLNGTVNTGLVSLPALGMIRPRKQMLSILVHVLWHMHVGSPDRAGSCPWTLRERMVPFTAMTRHVPSENEQIDVYLGLAGVRGRLQLLAGMLRNNRPWRLALNLSSAGAAAAAVAAFGIFYSSIWLMANSLPWWRLALISVLAVTAMVLWLAYYNQLWERPRKDHEPAKARLYNAATGLTLAAGVGIIYVTLYIVTIAGALVVIPNGYFSARLGMPAGFAQYGYLAWLACSMGTVAGALGSSFDSSQAVKEAYSKREQERLGRERAQRRAEGEEDASGRQ